MKLVTGAGGWLGSELVRQLVEKNETVRAFDFKETQRLKELKEKYPNNIDVFLGNICENEKIEQALENVDTIYHLAAKVHVVPTNKKDEEEFYKINTEATKNIFEKAIEKKIKRVIFFSTVSVYEQNDNKITVNSAKNPNTIYGKSKLEAENIANELYNKYKFPITIIEPVTVYGEGDVGNFKKLENLIQKGISIRFGNGNNKKTVIYYKDLIKMAIKIENDSSYIGKTVICGTEVLTINEINNILIQKVDKRVIKISIPQWLASVVKSVCCFSFLIKIRRKIIAMTQNNEFEIANELDDYVKFRNYELSE